MRPLLERLPRGSFALAVNGVMIGVVATGAIGFAVDGKAMPESAPSVMSTFKLPDFRERSLDDVRAWLFGHADLGEHGGSLAVDKGSEKITITRPRYSDGGEERWWVTGQEPEPGTRVYPNRTIHLEAVRSDDDPLRAAAAALRDRLDRLAKQRKFDHAAVRKALHAVAPEYAKVTVGNGPGGGVRFAIDMNTGCVFGVHDNHDHTVETNGLCPAESSFEEMPDLRWQSIQTAKGLLTSLGWQDDHIRIVPKDRAEPMRTPDSMWVVSQHPPHGTRTYPGEPIRLEVDDELPSQAVNEATHETLEELRSEGRFSPGAVTEALDVIAPPDANVSAARYPGGAKFLVKLAGACLAGYHTKTESDLWTLAADDKECALAAISQPGED